MLYLAALVVAIAAVLAVAGYMIVLPLQPHDGTLPEPSAEDQDRARRLRAHVTAVASVPHNIDHYRALEAAACYIEQQLQEMGQTPLMHEYVVDERPVRNIEIILPAQSDASVTGGDHRAPASTLVVGAHYDSPDDSPGANDNGTGVAALVEIARELSRAPIAGQRLDIRLVFFVNEEAPYGKTDAMGSLRHARMLKETGVPVTGMIALETLGYFTNEPNSQSYPPPFGLIYPAKGNFVAFVGLPGARRLVGRCLKAFRMSGAFPSIGGVAPGFIPGIDLSDHWAYDHCGFPALMVTDTAPFRNPYYHTRGDLPETVDYQSLARITSGLTRMVATIAR